MHSARGSFLAVPLFWSTRNAEFIVIATEFYSDGGAVLCDIHKMLKTRLCRILSVIALEYDCGNLKVARISSGGDRRYPCGETRMHDQ